VLAEAAAAADSVERARRPEQHAPCFLHEGAQLLPHLDLELLRADVDGLPLPRVQLLGQVGVVVEAGGDVVLRRCGDISVR
jgi:hypothetical protein